MHATVEFVDIAGLVQGAHQGEGLGNRFLAHIREVDAITFVLRAFEDDDVVLDSPGLRLVADAGASPGVFPTWSTYNVDLTKESFVDATDVGNPETATGKDMKKALRNLDNLYIRAEYRTGADTDAIDRVKLKSG